MSVITNGVHWKVMYRFSDGSLRACPHNHLTEDEADECARTVGPWLGFSDEQPWVDYPQAGPDARRRPVPGDRGEAVTTPTIPPAAWAATGGVQPAARGRSM